LACFGNKKEKDLGSERMVERAGDRNLWSVIIKKKKKKEKKEKKKKKRFRH
jgi:hypothetical protein